MRMTHSMINIRSKRSLEESEEGNAGSFAEPILITGPSPTAGYSTELNFARQKHR